MRARHQDRGSILPLVALVLVAAGGLMLGIGRLGAAAVERSRATLAADAAALAGAAEGEDAAREIAEANRGELVAFTADGPEVEVTVRVRGAAAKARARRSGGSPHTDGPRAGLSPVMLAAIARAEQLLGESVPIAAGYRRPDPTVPGTSSHERGMAIDVPTSFVPRLIEVASTAGLCRPAPRTDPVHFEPCRWSSVAR